MPATAFVSPRALVLALLIGLAAGARAQDGTLERVSATVRDGERDALDGGESGHGFEDWAGELYLEGDEGPLTAAVAWTILLPFLGPRSLLDDRGGRGDFAEYPYRDERGYWRTDGDPRGRRPWAVHPRVEVGTDFDDLERFGLGLELEHASRFGLDSAWNRWREELPSGAPGALDELDLADLNLVYRFAHSERAAFRAGLGLNYLNDARDHELGFNSTYAATFLPVRPLTLAFEGDLGTVGDATLVHLRAEAGFVLERFGLFASFDHFDLDGVELHSYGLGLRGWF